MILQKELKRLVSGINFTTVNFNFIAKIQIVVCRVKMKRR